MLLIYSQFLSTRQLSIELFFKEHTLLVKLYNQQSLKSKVYLLDQIFKFLPSKDFDILNWQFISQLFVGNSVVQFGA